ncbi:hypothetical protein ACJMK2_021276 [Sinanodonta woodiana]|uniref:MAM domain-containing protein n=1 Tax=Sinanodonta woodiana TaxID=1069815 RepID=A0ABD3TFL7_SINWO
MDANGATVISTFILILISLIGGIVTQTRRIYIYLDPKSVNTSQSQVLQNPLRPWSCLSLWYDICGNDTGKHTLSIETKDTTTATKLRTLQLGNMTMYWSREGELDDTWHRVEITSQTDEAIRVIFVGTTQIQNGAIAVDKNKLSNSCKDNCGFDVKFCNWIQRTSDGFRWIRTDGASFPKTTGSHSGCTNKTTVPQSAKINNTTGPQSYSITMKTTSQSGRTNKTTVPQSARIYNTTGLQSYSSITMQTTSQSGRTNKTTGPLRSRTSLTRPNKTGTRTTSATGDLKDSTFSVGLKDTYANTTMPAESNVTEASTNGSRPQETTEQHITVVTGTSATLTTRDFSESTFSWNKSFTTRTSPSESNIPASYTIDSGSQITTQGHIPNVTAGVITVSLIGAVMFVVLSLLIGVWIYRKCCRLRKMVEPVELQPIASKTLSRDDETGYSSSAASCSNPGYTLSSKTSRSSTKALFDGKTDDANYKYATAFQSSTPPQWTDDTYDNTGDETKPHSDRAYDHIPTHFVEEYDAPHLTMHTRLNASERYDHVIICPDDLYDETCAAIASTLKYQSYDHVITCPDDMYEETCAAQASTVQYK